MGKTPGLNLPFGIDPVNPVPVDSNYGPYDTLASAIAAIPLALRYDGLTVQITGLGNYWWEQSDLSDSGLKPKTFGGGAIDVLNNDVPVLTNVTKLNFVGTEFIIGAPSPSTGQVDIYIDKTWGLKKYILALETLTVLPDYQYFIYGDLTVAGTFNNHGEVVIANGALILEGTGQFNNLGSGLLKLINLATGSSIQVVIKTFSTVADTPLQIVHGLGTKDFTFNVREGNTLIDVQLTYIDNNTVEILTTADTTSANIVFQAKLT